MPELNPSAFPGGDFRGYEPDRGMTLLDYFAGQAIGGFTDLKPAVAAEYAYLFANAMLADRAKGSGA